MSKINSIEDLKSFLVNDLKNELKLRGASTQGKKAELCERLTNLIEKEILTKKEYEVADNVNGIDDLSTNSLNGSNQIEILKNKDENSSIVESDINLNGNEINIEESVTTDAANTNQGIESKVELENESNKPLQSQIILSNEVEANIASIVASNESNNEIMDINVDQVAEIIVSDNNQNNNLLIEEMRLKEKIFLNKAKKEVKKTKFVRIDNFQRPWNIKGLQQWLLETTSMTIDIRNIWFNSIKTHCYIDFETEEDAQKCIESVTGKVFPSTNLSKLVANFTAVSVADAPTSFEASQKPGQWRLNSASEDNQIKGLNQTIGLKRKGVVGVSLDSDSNNQSNLPSAQSSSLGGLNLFKKATAVAVATVPSKAFREEKRPISMSTQPTESVSNQTNDRKLEYFSKKHRGESSNSGKMVGTDNQPNSSYGLNENLRRKTSFLPSLSWCTAPAHLIEKRLLEKRATL
eukprot:gene5655-7810_t